MKVHKNMATFKKHFPSSEKANLRYLEVGFLKHIKSFNFEGTEKGFFWNVIFWEIYVRSICFPNCT